jgi:hypothetical protein
MANNSVITSQLKLGKELGVHTGSNRIAQFVRGAGEPNPQVVNVSDAQSVASVVKANGVTHIPLSGVSFYFVSLAATAGLNVRPNTLGQARSFINYVQGTGLRIGAGTFASIDLQNTTGSDIAFTMFIGGGLANGQDEFIDKRVILTGQTSNIFVQTGATVSYGYKTRDNTWADTLAGNATQDVADGYLGLKRKQVIFSNNDAALLLTVLDTNSNIIGTIQPATAFTFESGGDVKLHNPNGGSVACNIGEVYFL